MVLYDRLTEFSCGKLPRLFIHFAAYGRLSIRDGGGTCFRHGGKLGHVAGKELGELAVVGSKDFAERRGKAHQHVILCEVDRAAEALNRFLQSGNLGFILRFDYCRFRFAFGDDALCPRFGRV